MRESIGATGRYAVTLPYFLNGDGQTTIAANYRINRSTVCRIITSVRCYMDSFMREGFLTSPSTEERDIPCYKSSG